MERGKKGGKAEKKEWGRKVIDERKEEKVYLDARRKEVTRMDKEGRQEEASAERRKGRKMVKERRLKDLNTCDTNERERIK